MLGDDAPMREDAGGPTECPVANAVPRGHNLFINGTRTTLVLGRPRFFIAPFA